ncbi:Glycine cleavage system T protein (aminomethyltransferase) [Asanoa hainanensis]|uniref:Glycine cleavage system T protein (Aminomethyltransferase) n=1 Tax=Asanoa hainanensis TaxID=560556 RepID=A0A239GM26_9ACTN|nr:FAD-dependent oxidoreductase [Asanoa hainanensis]SNS70207.1 Glycine cleavage system T protein (aminomethyltransferase) [Asanoa hainanensis]
MAAPRVVIIGAGVVGAALADELSALGWTDVTVVEQGALPRPGGSSSHAPGLVFQTNAAKVMTGFARYTIDKLTRLGCFAPVGSLEVATSEARLADLHRRQGWLTAWGGAGRVLSPAECAGLHDLLGPVLGGLHVPGDGVANSVQAVSAQLARARVRVLDGHEVLDIRVVGDRVSGVVTSRGEVPADIVVCCAGIWGPRVARMVGQSLPLTPLAHQFGWTDPLPALAGQQAEAVRPILRHQDADLYLRERFDRVGVGYYGHRPMPIAADDIVPGPMPSVLPFTADDFEPGWAAAQDLLPALREAKVEEGMNGLFSFTTDNMPLLGPSAAVAGLWFAEAVWVTHSAGVARAVAEWLARGHCSSFDLHECDLNRFEPHQLAPDYVLARGCQNYVEVYDVIHPLQPMESPRPLRTTPFYPRQLALDAAFLEFAGWERPQWYGHNAALLPGREVPAPHPWAARYWSPIVGAEALATRETVALYDMTTLKRVEVTGPGAAAYLQWLTTGNVDRSVGTVTYCLLLDVDGGVRSDITVARLGPHEFQVGINGPLDVDWFARHLPADGSVAVRDTTAGTCCVGVWGPRARDLVQSLTVDDFSNEAFRYFRARRTYIGTVPVTALRLSYVGELGYELYTTADLGLKLWDTLWAAGQELGIVAGGRGAFASLRLEKGYRLFGTDLTYEHDPYEAGLDFAVKLDKGDFLGRSALASRTNLARRLTCLTLAEVVMGKEPVYAGDECVGHVTSAAYGYTVGTGIAYAWLPASLATPGQTVHIGYFDRRVPATVAAEPLFDPRMERLRA